MMWLNSLFRRKSFRHGKYSRAEKGQAVVETVVSMIIFSFMVGGIAALSAYLYMQHSLVSAARFGSRKASINSDIGNGNFAQGEQDITDDVIDFWAATTGQEITADDVTVDGPNGAQQGERTVTVTVNYELQNPVNFDGALQAIGAGPSGLGQIEMAASATMHYEE